MNEKGDLSCSNKIDVLRWVLSELEKMNYKNNKCNDCEYKKRFEKDQENIEAIIDPYPGLQWQEK